MINTKIRQQARVGFTVAVVVAFCSCASVTDDASGDSGEDTGTSTSVSTIDSDTGTIVDTESGTIALSTDSVTDTLQGTESESGSESNGNTGTDSITVDTDTGNTVDEIIFKSYPFTDGFDGFTGEGYTHDSANGWLVIEHEFSGANETRDLRLPINQDEANWSGVTEISAVVKVEQPILGGLQLFIIAGAAYSWCAIWNDIAYTSPAEWTTISTPVTACPVSSDMSLMKSIGLGIRTSSNDVGAQTIRMLVDEIYVKKVNTPGDTDVDSATDSEVSVDSDTATDFESDKDSDIGTDSDTSTDSDITVDSDTDSDTTP